MAGSIQLSGSQQFDAQGRPLSGGLLYFFQSGTTTPQNAFQDQALAIPYPNPIVLTADGRVPFFYLADGNIKIRLTDNTGVTVITADGLLVIGPSSGGGGGGGVDATTVLATGDVKARYGTGVLSGFVRLNGRTIGSGTSGGTELAAAGAQALFEYLWTTDANLAVSGGRGGTANADWLANKTIALPDLRGRAIAGMDDMGGAAASRLTSTFFGATATTLGAAGGGESNTLITGNLPSHTHGVNGSTGGASVAHTHTFTTTSDGAHMHSLNGGSGYLPDGGVGATSGGTGRVGGSAIDSMTSAGAHTHSGTTSGESVGHTHTISITSDPTGSGTAMRVVGPAMVMTFYMKL